MSEIYAKPLPVIDDGNRPFWDGCAAGALRLQRCADCHHLRYPINAVCPRCLAADHTWETLSGQGTVYSTIVFHQVYHEAFRGDLPYNVAMIQLAEGPRMISNVTGVAAADVRVGDAVSVWFDRVTADIAIPRFRRDATLT